MKSILKTVVKNLDCQWLYELMWSTLHNNALVNVTPPPPPTPGKYGALAIKQNQTVIMPHIQGPLILSNPLPKHEQIPPPSGQASSNMPHADQVTNRISVCEVGTVSKISVGQAEGSRFNTPPGRGLNLRRPSFATPSVDRDVKLLV